MDDIKRANFFTGHKLVEADLSDEQAYHVTMRRRHNVSLHSAGVVSGLEVTRAAAKAVRIDPGVAIDDTGRELVLEEARTYALASSGTDVDVFLTLAYAEEASDPVTHDGVSSFIRTKESPSFADSTAAPAANGAAILLARIRLDAAGAIDTGSSAIVTAVRTIASAHIAAGAIGTGHLADDTVAVENLAIPSRPLTLQAANAVTVELDGERQRVTIGESHSARTDNPHAVTAAQIDTQGGAQNQIVARINAGLGVIAQARIAAAPVEIVAGSFTFPHAVDAGAQVSSEDIDAGLGSGPLCLQLALDELPSDDTSIAGDADYGRPLRYFASLNRSTGRFKIGVWRIGGPAAVPQVRWLAVRPQPGPNSSVAVSIAVTPQSATVTTQNVRVDAIVTHATNASVNWVVNGGTVLSTTSTSVTWRPPAISGQYQVAAVAVADTTKSAACTITVNAPIFVTIDPTSTSVLDGRQVSLTARVTNATTNSNVNWSIVQGAGTLSASTTASGTAVTFTAPSSAMTCKVRATSVQDPGKNAEWTLTVFKVDITITPQSAGVVAGGQLNVFSSVTGLPPGADTRVNWSVVGGGAGGSFEASPTNTGRFNAPTRSGASTVRGTSVADSTKFDDAQIQIAVPPGGGGGTDEK